MPVAASGGETGELRGGESLRAQLCHDGVDWVGEWRHGVGSQDPAEQVIGQGWVTREGRTVQVRPEDVAREHAVDDGAGGVGHPVAVTDDHAAERANPESERRTPAVILEAGQGRESGRRIRFDDAFADQATVARARGQVHESEPVEDLAVGRLVGGAEELEPCTHREHRSATRERAVDRGA